MTAAAGMGALRPMSDLAQVERDLNEIASRQGQVNSEVPDLAVNTLNPKAIWDRYNRRAKR